SDAQGASGFRDSGFPRNFRSVARCSRDHREICRSPRQGRRVMPSFERTFMLQVPSSTENLAIIRDFMTGIAAQAGLADGEAAKLELAVDEGCANVIEHAYGPDTTKEVSVNVTVDDDAIYINVVDTGQGFDP